MITITDALNTLDLGDYYAILPTVSFNHTPKEYIDHYNANYVPEGFHYSSGENSDWETVESIREKIRRYVDPCFF